MSGEHVSSYYQIFIHDQVALWFFKKKNLSFLQGIAWRGGSIACRALLHWALIQVLDPRSHSRSKARVGKYRNTDRLGEAELISAPCPVRVPFEGLGQREGKAFFLTAAEA